MPHDPQKNNLFNHYVTTHAERKNERNYKFERNLFAQFDKNFLPVISKFDTGARIIDLGCGDGSLLRWLSTRNFKNTMGFDISLEQVSQATKYGLKNVRLGDILDRSYYEKADIFFLRDVAEHLELRDLTKLFDLVSEFLRPDGVLIIQTINANSPIAASVLYADATHCRAFTERSLSQLFRATNLEPKIFLPWYRFAPPTPLSILNLFILVMSLIMSVRLKIELGNVSKIHTVNLIAVAGKACITKDLSEKLSYSEKIEQ